jgi:hypothetical protein
MSSEQDQEQMRSSWSDYRFWDWVTRLLYLGFFPVSLIGLNTSFESAIFWIAAISFAAVVNVVGYRAKSFRCPRCGKPFFCWGLYHNGFTRKCLHCGLPKWAKPGTDKWQQGKSKDDSLYCLRGLQV